MEKKLNLEEYSNLKIGQVIDCTSHKGIIYRGKIIKKKKNPEAIYLENVKIIEDKDGLTNNSKVYEIVSFRKDQILSIQIIQSPTENQNQKQFEVELNQNQNQNQNENQNKNQNQNQNRYHRNRNYGRSRGRQYNDHKQEEIESNWDICVESFDKMGLKEGLSRGIYGYWYEEPSIIQQKGIQPIIEGRDVIGQAQPGTGKTTTFAIGVLQKIERNYLTQALILAPTRELASQIGLVVEGLSEYMDVKSYVCIGGTDVEKDKEMLRKGQNIIVGTPRRVIHMIIDEHLKTENIKMLIMDEADELLSRGFKDQIYQIFQELPKDVQVLLFSATIPR
ncbi:eukaryotic initiation factor 4a-11 [Anaeramoeba ignava]|uniref:Eukaryotic initiation factor 4a-11 n=1 Tax=Anaeramoeba ignava TaxID=1746090 RepID=A0A9Q0R7T2_ANAIG|nr:eukaryotic initiation factor 4a-11 [Anaeramoeba ignava]